MSKTSRKSPELLRLEAEARETAAALANAKRPKEPDYLGPAELPPTRIAGADYPASEG